VIVARRRAALLATWIAWRAGRLGDEALRRVGARRGGPWRPRSDPVRGRGRALRDEIGYWHDWLASGGGKYAEDYAYRFEPESQVADPVLREILSGVSGDSVSILDVGAGPVTSVGYRFPGKDVAIVATDPLADAYDRSMRQAGVTQPVRTIAVDGERLLEHFGPDRFDIAYARNSVDHAVDPARIIEQMLGVVRPQGHVVLRHVQNEARRQDYVQLHQWNFDLRDGELILWREGRTIHVGDLLSGRATISCRHEPIGADGDAAWIVAVIAKLRPDAPR
jgi:SAM-dependent methyltransferase